MPKPLKRKQTANYVPWLKEAMRQHPELSSSEISRRLNKLLGIPASDDHSKISKILRKEKALNFDLAKLIATAMGVSPLCQSAY